LGEKSATDFAVYAALGHFLSPRLCFVTEKTVCTLSALAERVFLFERRIKVVSEVKKRWAVELLKKKRAEIGRLPKKDDFDEITRSRIKAFLGPWPRALEAAGLKEKRMKRKRRF
jgi:hypothetical protein